jgi:hypothetical protein
MGYLAVYHLRDCSIRFRLMNPFSVFTAELPAISLETPGDYVILTDNLSSIRAMESLKISLHTHPIVFECKLKIWELGQGGLVG